MRKRASSSTLSLLLIPCLLGAVAVLLYAPVFSQTLRLPAAAEVQVVLLETVPGDAETHLVVQSTASDVVASSVATLHHAPGGHAKGTLLNATTGQVVVVADMPGRGDPSWNAALFLMSPHGESVQLADHVYTGTRPAVLSDGRVVVPRGKAGPPPAINLATGIPDTLRVDSLRVDVIDPVTKETTTIFRDEGYFTFLIGALGQEVYLYRFKPGHADILAIDAILGEARTLASSIAPYARDFSIDPIARSILYTQRAPDDATHWVVEQLAIDSKERRVLATRDHMAIYPHAWAGDTIVMAGSTGGLVKESAAATSRGAASAQQVVNADDHAVVDVRAMDTRRSIAIAQKTKEGALGTPIVIEMQNGEHRPLPTRNGVRTDIVGVIE